MPERDLLTPALARARALRARGLSVIPVPPPRPGRPTGAAGDGKVPLLAWRAYQERLPTDAELEAWFGGEPMNLAVVTGAVSGVVVVDADSPEALRWATRRLVYTPWQTQTASGFHLWYRHPGGHVPNRARVETEDGRLSLDLSFGTVMTGSHDCRCARRNRHSMPHVQPRSRRSSAWRSPGRPCGCGPRWTATCGARRVSGARRGGDSVWSFVFSETCARAVSGFPKLVVLARRWS